MRNTGSAILMAAALCLSPVAHAAPAAAPPQQDSDYQAMVRCYGFHFFKIEMGTVIKNDEITAAGRDQSALDLAALRVYSTKKGVNWATIQAAADASAKARRAAYVENADQDAGRKAMMDDQEFCTSDAFVDILLRYQ